MFEENFGGNQLKGRIEVICGSMFSGKTEELIRRVKRALIAKQEVVMFKPARDTRDGADVVVSHDARAMRSITVEKSIDILGHQEDFDVCGIDEAQFFDEGLVAVCERLMAAGKRVVIAGLDMDFMGKPFHPMPELMAIADHVLKVHAICVHCGRLANHSYRLSEVQDQFHLGAQEAYEPRCRQCFSMGNMLHLDRGTRKS